MTKPSAMLAPVSEAEIEDHYKQRFGDVKNIPKKLTSQHMRPGWVFQIEGMSDDLCCLSVCPEYAYAIIVPNPHVAYEEGKHFAHLRNWRADRDRYARDDINNAKVTRILGSLHISVPPEPQPEELKQAPADAVAAEPPI